MKNNDRPVTIRIPLEVFDKLTKEAIDRSVKENRIIKISEIIREKLTK
jgi:transcriptional regulator of met regulon